MSNVKNQIVLFDGVCNFCNGAVNFVIDHDPTHQFKFASLQSDVGQQLLAQNQLDSTAYNSVILFKNGQLFQKSDAVLEIAHELRGMAWLYVFRYIPRVLRDGLYNLFAQNRYRIFGRTDTCRLPTAEEKELFLA